MAAARLVPLDDVLYQTGHTYRNWARTVACRPSRFYAPRDEVELIKIIRLAHARNQKVKVTGASHSLTDLPCTDSGWLVNLDALSTVLGVDREQRLVHVQAGMRLSAYIKLLDSLGWDMPVAGTIRAQSIAGAVSTATHGTSAYCGSICDQVVSMTLITSTGERLTVSETQHPDIFRAALVSFGAIGVIVQLVMKAVPSFNLETVGEIYGLERFYDELKEDRLWHSAPYVKCLYYPHSQRILVLRSSVTDKDVNATPSIARRAYNYFDKHIVYQAMLYLLRLMPSYIPAYERRRFKHEYGWKDSSTINLGIARSCDTFTCDCLFSQVVSEWAVPSSKSRDTMIEVDQTIRQAASDGFYVHFPLEVRVTANQDKAYLSMSSPFPHAPNDLIFFINFIIYRPLFSSMPYRRYFDQIENIFRKLQGRPHWAKHHTMTRTDLTEQYGREKFDAWCKVRNTVDPEMMFINE